MELGQSTRVLVDIGNSNITWVVMDGDDSRSNICSVSTAHYHDFFVQTKEISNPHFYVSSVVPNLNVHFHSSCTTFVEFTNLPDLQLDFPNPDQVGADLLVTALAGYRKAKGAVLIIDSGTALTFSLVDSDGVYRGGQIFPGMGIASKSLNDYTAKVPVINVEKVEFLVGNTTRHAVQSGLYHGYKSLIQGMMHHYRHIYSDLYVIGTGAGLDLFQDSLDFDAYEPYLIFDGLDYIADCLSG